MPTTVAAMAQKQVAMFELPRVTLSAHHVAEFWSSQRGTVPVTRHLRGRNTVKNGLGRALPAGQVVVFEPLAGQPMLAGQGMLDDAAVGQDIDIAINRDNQVTASLAAVASGRERHGKTQDGKAQGGRAADSAAPAWTQTRLTLANAHPWPIRFEAKIRHPAETRIVPIKAKTKAQVELLGTQATWKIVIPAHGTARLEWREVRPK